MLRKDSAMTAEREALRLGIEYLTVLFPTEVSSFDFQVESTDRTLQYKLNAQSLCLFGLHRDVNDASRWCESSPKTKHERPRVCCALLLGSTQCVPCALACTMVGKVLPNIIDLIVFHWSNSFSACPSFALLSSLCSVCSRRSLSLFVVLPGSHFDEQGSMSGHLFILLRFFCEI